jgi:flagellar export protein FliJ
MSAFRFRLAGVLAIWQRREDRALTVLQGEIAECAVARADIERLLRARDEARSGAMAAIADRRGGHDPAWHRNWITRLARQLDAAQQQLAKCEAREASARAAWQRARRDRRVIERLRDRAGRRHEVDERRRELIEMDERAGVRAQKEQAW